MEDCGRSLTYQGKTKPSCNGGKPCRACKDKYVTARLTKILHAGHDVDPIYLRNQAADALEVISS